MKFFFLLFVLSFVLNVKGTEATGTTGTIGATGNEGYAERDQFTFKSQKVKNEQGVVTHVRVEAYVGTQLVEVFTTELMGEPMETTADEVGQLTETDLNGDGIADVSIYLGYYGSHPNDVSFEALLWDPQQHRFLQADGYKELPDPMFDADRKLISTNLRSGPDHRVTDYYRWRGNKIEHLRSETWAIADTESVDFSGLGNLPCYRFDAKLDGRIPVIVVFQKSDDDLLAGYIYYPRAKHPAPILIKGALTRHKGFDHYCLRECQPDGTSTGTITLQVKCGEYYFNGTMSGTWTHPTNEKTMQMTSIQFSREMPKWFTKSVVDR